MINSHKWVFIINPVAGAGYAQTLESIIRLKTTEASVDAEIVFTERRGHAKLLSEEYYRKGYKYIIGVGGDGTFNEIASALAGIKDVITGLIPAGTGNDFIQILGFHDRLTDTEWQQFFKAEIVQLDSGSCNGMLFFNGMGLGFDAQVASENYTAPGEVKKGGKNKYIWHILKTLLFYKEKKMRILNGGTETESDCFINTVAIGRRFAGGFFLTPGAIANDGLLDVCSVKKLSLPQRLRILMMVPKGTHINDRKVNYYQTGALSISFPSQVPFHLDGELYFSDHFDIKVVPAALNIIYNPVGNHFFKKA